MGSRDFELSPETLENTEFTPNEKVFLAKAEDEKHKEVNHMTGSPSEHGNGHLIM